MVPCRRCRRVDRPRSRGSCPRRLCAMAVGHRLRYPDLPEHQKQNWINMFNHYVFNFDNKNFDHIPGELNGSHKEINDDLAKELRTLLLKNLNR